VIIEQRVVDLREEVDGADIPFAGEFLQTLERVGEIINRVHVVIDYRASLEGRHGDGADARGRPVESIVPLMIFVPQIGA
jgi:hypothetical protein